MDPHDAPAPRTSVTLPQPCPDCGRSPPDSGGVAWHAPGCPWQARELTLRVLMSESLFAVGAVIWIYWRELPLSWTAEPWPLAVLAGLAAAVAVFAVALFIFYCAPDVPGVRSLRRVFREMRPMFSTLRMPHLILISVAAGVGEELFFRGALQTNSNWVVASICFGLAHVGGRDTLMYGVLAMAIGAGLSGLAAATGGLLAPIVAHAVYDAAALAFCRWGNHANPGAPAAPGDLDDREPTQGCRAAGDTQRRGCRGGGRGSP